ncbi:MAG TPA: M48 family metalloprotease [Stellaceae bacterium]|nr:M48 family metalloprotease [Stellaceae bacterium]
MTPHGLPIWRAPIAPRDAAEERRRRRRNWVHSAFLLLAICALLAYCGWIVAGRVGLTWSLVAGVLCLVVVRQMPADALLNAIRAAPLSPRDVVKLGAPFAVLCRRAGLDPVPRLYHLAHELPLAFSLGEGEHAAVVVADSLIERLSARELCGILAHEIIHLRNGDIVLMQLGMVLGFLTGAISRVGFLLIFLDLLMQAFSLAEFPLLSLAVLAVAPIVVGLLRLALSRIREAEADLEAAELTGDPLGLAAALDKLRVWQQQRMTRLSPMMRPLQLPKLLSDHPPTEERIRRLRAMGGR